MKRFGDYIQQALKFFVFLGVLSFKPTTKFWLGVKAEEYS